VRPASVGPDPAHERVLSSTQNPQRELVMRIPMSRRHILTAATVFAGAVASLVLVEPGRAADGSAATSDSQLKKQDVAYQDQPKGEQRCATCKNFLAPSGCRVVSGSINPNGWCLLFKPKTA
jgi:hypothetical protein